MIEKAWKLLEALAIPNTASAIQRAECRKYFYCGVAHMLSVNTSLTALSEDEGCRLLDQMLEELNAYTKELLN